KTRVAESRADAAETSLAVSASKPVGNNSTSLRVENNIAEICTLKEKLQSEASSSSRWIPAFGDSINGRLVETLEGDKKKLMSELENMKLKNQNMERSMKSLEQRHAILQNERSQEFNVMRVAGSDEGLDRMRDKLEEMRKELSITREINKQIATISLGGAIKELDEVKGKNMKLEEQMRMQSFAGTNKEIEELKKRNALLMQDNIKLMNSQKSIKSCETEMIKNNVIQQQRDKLANENRELRSKLDYYQKFGNIQGVTFNADSQPLGKSPPGHLLHHPNVPSGFIVSPPPAPPGSIMSPPSPLSSMPQVSSSARPSVPPRFCASISQSQMRDNLY
ncbi:hypothetical protein PMAYCL1PPCAC_07508, partial [Pristionchus mayeri]